MFSLTNTNCSRKCKLCNDKCNDCVRTVSTSEDNIGAGAAKLNTFAQRCRQEVLAGFELHGLTNILNFKWFWANSRYLWELHRLSLESNVLQNVTTLERLLLHLVICTTSHGSFTRRTSFNKQWQLTLKS